MSIHTTLLLGLCLIPWLVFPAATNAQPPTFFSESDSLQISFPDPGPGGGQPYGRTHSCELNGDFYTDLVVMRGNQPYFVCGPTLFQTLVPFAEGATDFAILPTQGPSGTDAIMIVGGAGAGKWVYHPGQKELIRSAVDGPWDSCKRILAGDITDNGRIDLVAVRGNDMTILVQHSPFGFPTPGPSFSFSATAPILDIALLNWSGNSNLEIAVITTSGIEIYNFFGNERFAFSVTTAAAVIAPFRQSGYPRDRLAVAAEFPTNNALFILDQTGIETPAINFGAIKTVGIDAGDVDDDGSDDLVLRSDTTEEVIVFYNSSAGTPTFSMANSSLIDIGLGDAPATGDESFPDLSDFDLDGDLDLFVCSFVQDTAYLLSNQVFDRSTITPTLTSSTVYVVGGNQPPSLGMVMDEPLQQFIYYNSMEWTIYKGADAFSNVAPVPYYHAYDPVDPWPSAFSLSLDQVQDTSSAVHYVIFRLAHINPITARPERVGPHTLVAFSTDSTPEMSALYGFLFSTRKIRFLGGQNPGNNPDSTEGPGFTPPPSIPPGPDMGGPGTNIE